MTDLRGFDEHLVSTFDAAPVVPVALLAAAAVGAAHGLAPGHGKTLAAAYLIGTHARRREAAVLAGVVAGMHTASVLALGLLWWVSASAGRTPLSAVTHWAQLAVALTVVTIGVILTRRRWRERGTAHHHHHHHVPEHGARLWSRTHMLGIATTGGLLPSPSAFLVLVSGLVTGRTGLAVAMVVAFGVGLAVTVLASAIIVLAGRDWLARSGPIGARFTAVLHRAPLVAACAVLAGGCFLTVVAFDQLVTA